MPKFDTSADFRYKDRISKQTDGVGDSHPGKPLEAIPHHTSLSDACFSQNYRYRHRFTAILSEIFTDTNFVTDTDKARSRSTIDGWKGFGWSLVFRFSVQFSGCDRQMHGIGGGNTSSDFGEENRELPLWSRLKSDTSLSVSISPCLSYSRALSNG
jgi:hypothetical protein